MNDSPEDESSKNTGSETVSIPVPGEAHDEASSIAGETMEQVGTAGGESPAVSPDARIEKSTGRSAFLVGAGILISRVIGLIRQRVFAYYFGTSAAGDAFSAAFRIPNSIRIIHSCLRQTTCAKRRKGSEACRLCRFWSAGTFDLLDCVNRSARYSIFCHCNRRRIRGRKTRVND